MVQASVIKDLSICELANKCPYYQGYVHMSAELKEQYCRGDYRWCGRYMGFQALESERFIRLMRSDNDHEA